MNKIDNSLIDKLKMTPKQSEVLNSYKDKVANTKFVINTETYSGVNTLQTKKKFYNRSLELFTELHFGKENHFGSMSNNFKKVIEFLKLDEIIDFKLKVPTVTTKSLTLNSPNANNFENFEANSVFEVTFYALENVDSKIFLKAIETVENHFLSKYNALAKEEINAAKRVVLAKKKEDQKKELITYGSVGLILIVAVFLFLKFLK